MRIAIVVGAAALTLACALPARAGDQFEEGFKDELGRIAARQAVSGARFLLIELLSANWQTAQTAPPDPPIWEHRHRTPRTPHYEREHGDHRDRLHDPAWGHYDHTHEPLGYHCHP